MIHQRLAFAAGLTAFLIVSPAWATPPLAAVTLSVADWVPAWDAQSGGWALALSGKAPNGRFVANTSTGYVLDVPVGRYDVYWIQRGDLDPIELAAGLEVGPGGATVEVSTGLHLETADWAAHDDTAHWTALLPNGPTDIVNESSGDAMMLPPGTYDIYWDAGADAALGYIKRVTLQNTVGGVGLQILLGADGVHVSSVTPGGPGDRAGIVANDVIVTADDVSLGGLDEEETVRHLQGVAGTSVALGIVRGVAAEPTTINVTRELVGLTATVRAESGVHLDAPGLSIDPHTGWWGLVTAGGTVDDTVPVNRSANPDLPLAVPPGTYDVWWQANQDTAPVKLLSGIAVSEGAIVEAAVPAAAAPVRRK